jgi:hypothetical protein
MEGGRGLLPPWMAEKLSSPPRHSALACRARLSCTLRRGPWGSEASRALHRHRGGPNLKMLPLSLRAFSSRYDIIDLYIKMVSLSLLDLLNRLLPRSSRGDDPMENLGAAGND